MKVKTPLLDIINADLDTDARLNALLQVLLASSEELKKIEIGVVENGKT